MSEKNGEILSLKILKTMKDKHVCERHVREGESDAQGATANIRECIRLYHNWPLPSSPPAHPVRVSTFIVSATCVID